MIQDEFYWDQFEELAVKLDRNPTYEEVQEYIENKFKITEEEKIEYLKELYATSNIDQSIRKNASLS